ncbi:hypothetical protein OAB57_02200 [Bacteriovoracaceae bacterium]|nr:hypothetical protein [Bacteriovoracaceae bacterium]
MTKDYTREHTRAPLRTYFLFDSGGHAHRASLKNISVGGALIGDLPFIPTDEEIFGILKLPNHKKILYGSLEELEQLVGEDIDCQIFRVSIDNRRQLEQKRNGSDLFRSIGVRFLNALDLRDKAILEYVEAVTHNTVQLLRLLDSRVEEENRVLRIKLYARYLRENFLEDLSAFRNVIYQHYRSMQE